jgi:hypothetical protein
MSKSHPSAIDRRAFLGRSLAAAAGGMLGVPAASRVVQAAETVAPIDIGSRRELFVDDYLIERLADGAQLRLHHPQPREIALVHDAPWEGSGCGYHSVFQDGRLYRMYYKAWHLDVQPPGKVTTNTHPLYCCYAESDDGIHWRKPELGQFEFNGSKQNNITMAPGKIGSLNPDPGHPAVFKDDNPQCPADARYKAIFRSGKPRGLLPFKSADGLHWSPMSDAPVITEGAFDSQNLAFWDPVRKEYRAYWRIFTAGETTEKNWKPSGVRAIRTATSKDFLTWGPHADLTYVDSPAEHLYTNGIKPYHRAPHIFIGFPARYIERGWSDSMRALPELEHREMRAKASLRYGTAISEGLMMASRDGVKFKRWNEAFLRPGIEREGTWHYGHQYIAWHVVETKSDLEGAPPELSLYAVESYWTGNSSAVRRYTLRLDGFVSVNAPMKGGELLTRPLTFQGSKLSLNFSTSAAGDIRVEIQDAAGNPLPGFTLEDCPPVFGDSLERTVMWKIGGDVSSLAGKPVRLRFVLRDADLYALRFVA